MVKRAFFSVACATLLISGVGYAQPSATLTLKSGQVISGQLVDLGGSGYTIKVNGQNQTISQNDVAVIDFTGSTMSSTDWSHFNGTPQIVKRDGSTIDGQVTDIGGISPLRLTVQTSSGSQDLSSNDVSRIILARPANAPVATMGGNPTASPRGAVNPTAPGAAGGAASRASPRTGGTNRRTSSRAGGTMNRRMSQNGGAITVPANQPWTATGFSVQRGQQLGVSATGDIQLSQDPNDVAGPEGSRSRRMAGGAPVRRTPAGALIGKVGNDGQPFAIGNNTTIAMPASGQLFLGVNDDGFGDNRGAFQVTLTIAGR